MTKFLLSFSAVGYHMFKLERRINYVRTIMTKQISLQNKANNIGDTKRN